MKPIILFLFNSSTYAMQPWIDAGGYDVVTVDFDATDHSGAHKDDSGALGYTRLNIDLSTSTAVADVMEALEWQRPSFVVSFAPCTDLAVSGAAHFARKLEANPLCQLEAASMAKLASAFDCPYVVENPISVLSSLWRKPDMYYDPIDFSGTLPVDDAHPEFSDMIPARDAYFKRSCLWLGNGAKAPEVNVAAEHLGAERKEFHGHVKLGGKSARTKYIRSLTPRGLANALFQANSDITL